MNDLTEFRELGLSEITLEALRAKGFEKPSAIQKLAIPGLLSGSHDLIGQAQTGTGKTAAFALPMLETLSRSKKIQALVLSPTRELCLQIAEEMESLKGASDLRIAPFYGGQSIEIQLQTLKKGVDIAIGTPGRIMDHMRRGSIRFDGLKFAVLDEADEMLDMGFVEDIETILAETNSEKRMLMFSATMPDEVRKIAEKFMQEPEIIRAEPEAVCTNLTEQFYYEVKREDKFAALSRLIDIHPDMSALVFCRTRVDVDELVEKLNTKGYNVEALHGDIAQAQRTRVINRFKAHKFRLLIATDVAARGIDVNNLTHVINYSIPHNAEVYIHRIGRTGRAGRHGTAVTFVTPGERRKIKFIEKDIGTPIPLKKLPEIADIINAKKEKFAEMIALLIETGDADEYLNFAEELCTLGSHPAEALAAVLKMHFKNELLASTYTEFASKEKQDDSNMKKLLLFAGRADGITVPALLAEICERTGIRSNQLGKIICRADKTFLHATDKDAEKILKAFKNDPEWRFKYDEPREERRRKKAERSADDSSSAHTEKSADKPAKKRRDGKKKEKKTAPDRKPLREEFWSWIGEE